MAFLPGYTHQTPITVTGVASVSDYAIRVPLRNKAMICTNDSQTNWFASNMATHYNDVGATYDRTYIGFFTSSWGLGVKYYDHDDHRWSEETILHREWGKGDDHANPACHVIRNSSNPDGTASRKGRVLIAAGEHSSSDNGKLSCWISDSAEDISTFSSEIVIEAENVGGTSGGHTYANIIEVSDGTLFLFVRRTHSYNVQNPDANWRFFKSLDSGFTWESPVEATMFTEFAATESYNYFMVTGDPTGQSDYIDIIGTGSYDDAFIHMYYARTNDASQYGLGTWRNSNNEVLKKLDGTTDNVDDATHTMEAFRHTTMERFHTTPGSGTTMSGYDKHVTPWHVQRVGHVASGAVSILLVEDQDHVWASGLTDEEKKASSKHVLRYTNEGTAESTWVVETVIGNGVDDERGDNAADMCCLWDWFGYPGGAKMHSGNPDVVYAGIRGAYDKNQMSKWERKTGGIYGTYTWVKTDDITAGSDGENCRPHQVDNASDDLAVLWSHNTRFIAYTDWKSCCLAYPMTDCVDAIPINGHVNEDFSNIRFTEDDGTTKIGDSENGIGWTEKLIKGVYSIIWIKTPSIISGDVTYLMQYGHLTDEGLTGALKISNDEAQFLFLDHFDDIAHGTAIPIDAESDAKWDDLGGNENVFNGVLTAHSTNVGAWDGLLSKATFEGGVLTTDALLYRALDTSGTINTSFGFGSGDSRTSHISFYGKSSGVGSVYTKSNGSTYEIVLADNNPFRGARIHDLRWDLGTSVKAYSESILYATSTTYIHGAALPILIHTYKSASAPITQMLVNWVHVRPFLSTEPTMLAGAEVDDTSTTINCLLATIVITLYEVSIPTTVVCSLATLTVLSFATTIPFSITIDCGKANVSINSFNTVLSFGTTVIVTLKTIVFEDFNTTVTGASTVECSIGSISIIGYNAIVDKTISCTFGTITLQSYVTEISTTIVCITPDVRFVTLQTSITFGTDVNCSVSTLVIGSYNTSVASSTVVDCTIDDVNILAYNVNIEQPITVTCTSKDVIFDGHVVSLETTVFVDCNVEVLIIASYNASIPFVPIEIVIQIVINIPYENRISYIA